MAIGGHVELADILRIHGQAWLAGHTLGRSQAKAWRAIVACRTAALGGHIEQCDSCGTIRHVFHDPLATACRIPPSLPRSESAGQASRFVPLISEAAAA